MARGRGVENINRPSPWPTEVPPNEPTPQLVACATRLACAVAAFCSRGSLASGADHSTAMARSVCLALVSATLLLAASALAQQSLAGAGNVAAQLDSCQVCLSALDRHSVSRYQADRGDRCKPFSQRCSADHGFAASSVSQCFWSSQPASK